MAWGGLGDLLGYMASIVWIAKTYKHIEGTVHCLDFFSSIARNLLKDFPKWHVELITCQHPMVEIAEQTAPLGYFTWQSLGFVTACKHRVIPLAEGMHMVDAGFTYFLQQNPPPPEGNFLPELDLSEVKVLELPKRYAVMTPATNVDGLRKLPSVTFNEIKKHFLKRGITPVFIGKAHEKGHFYFPKEYDYEGGIDLRNKTSILEAAKIIQGAQCIVGLDNGLLHLAACTGAVPIVFGYNIVAPEHRRPRRREGLTLDVHPNPEELTCTFCRSRMRMVNDLQSSHCIYADLKCLEVLSDLALWTEKIDLALNETNENP